MAEFLSPDWVDALDAAARAAVELRLPPTLQDLVFEQRVTSTPGGDVSYHLVVTPTGARVEHGSAPAADVVLTTDFETAVALHRGTTNLQRALGDHRVKLGGHPASLVHRAEILQALGDVFASLRDSTTISEGHERASGVSKRPPGTE